MSDEKSDPAAAAAALSSSSSSPYTHDTRPHIPSDAIEMTDQASADTIVRAQTDSLSNDHDANNAPEVTAEEALTQLSTQEQEILKKQVETPEGKYGFKDLYRYATGLDIAIILVSSVCAAASGASLPIMAILFGGTQGVFQSYLAFQSITLDEFRSQMAEFVLYFVYLAIGTFAATYISTVGFIYTGEHISGKIRQKYLESCLRQNIGFFDKLGIGEVTVKITTDTTQIQDGISEKVGLLVSSIATVITGYAIGFAKSWKLTLILSSTLFALLISSAVGTAFIIRYVVPMGISAGKAGGVADEVLGSVRIATAFGNQNRLIGNYDSHLAVAQEWGFKLKTSVSIMTAVSLSLLYLNYGLGFWQGSIFMAQGNLDVENMIITIMAVMMGSFTVGTIGPYIQVFLEAIATSGRLYNVIDRNTPLDATSNEGETLPKVTGHLRLETVKHIYPSRPDVTVMDEVTLDVPPGKITAIVGASGSGKSTIVGLIQRFYSPVNGRILLDGVDITTINLRWLRQQMAVVNQEPVLFAVSIFDNIRYGLLGTEWENSTEEKQRELVTEAAKMANAHEFISQLPQGYDTNVGQRGFLLSGGQKQRIAIARAVVSNPKILLLDEATSALDTKSEVIIQAALENASKGRTTIMIAHRLSTIRDAHNIVVMSRGKIVEQGNHHDLLDKQGVYYDLIAAQQFTAQSPKASEPLEETEIDDKEEMMRRLSQMKNSPATRVNSSDRDDETSPRRRGTGSVIEDKKDADKEYGFWTLSKFLFSFNKTEWKLLVLGFFSSIISGATNPAQAVFFAKQMIVLSYMGIPGSDRWEIQDDSDFWSLMFLMIGIVQFIASILQGIAFAYCAEVLVRRVRKSTFGSLLRQDMAYFDQPQNSVGALSAFLAVETMQITGISGSTLGTILTSVTNIVAGIAVSLAIGWKLALVCFSMVPLVLACGFFRYFMLYRYQNRAGAAYASSAAFAVEHISSMRTIASLTLENKVSSQYEAAIAKQQAESLKSVAKSSCLYSASHSVTFLCIGLGFWYGSTLMATAEYTIFQFFVCLMAIVFGAQAAGTFFTFIPEIVKAKHSANQLKKLFDTKPVIDTWDSQGQTLANVEGRLEFRNVYFRYPTRPERPVLRGIDITVEPGQHVALVGASGCGKSTTVSLLERFYDPIVGQILIDGHDISELQVNDYRSHLALVNQEPTLYQGTIRENICYGSRLEEVAEEDIVQASRDANIYDFIVSLPDGFDSLVGVGGALLSGGQKQRIAIARALIRSPKILLLDEATSALDSESESIVQAALDRAAEGRTTVTIAHRLSSIQHADKIYVIDQGRIAESGTHSQLMEQNGRYAELVELQSMS